MFILIVYSWPLTKEVTWTNICEGVQYSQNTKSTQNNSRESETNTELSKSRWEINAYLNIKVRLCTYLYLHYIKNSCKEKGKGTEWLYRDKKYSIYNGEIAERRLVQNGDYYKTATTTNGKKTTFIYQL